MYHDVFFLKYMAKEDMHVYKTAVYVVYIIHHAGGLRATYLLQLDFVVLSTSTSYFTGDVKPRRRQQLITMRRTELRNARASRRTKR